jgi:RNA polymerase sigma-70 factor (ECF subfamily)
MIERSAPESAAMTDLIPDLVKKAQAGDQDAFARLYAHFMPLVHRRVWHLVPNQDVDDVTQDVFIAVIRSLKSFRGESKFSTWLRTLTNRQVANFYRNRERKQAEIIDAVDLTEEEHAPADPNVNLRRYEDFIALRSALLNLPDHYQEILLLRFVEHLAFKEIAIEIDKTLDATKSLFRRALAALQEEVG